MESSPLAGQSILITGATGSFGQAFTRRCLAEGARRVVVFSRGEAKQAEMRAALGDERVRYLIGDVRDANRVLDACRGVDVVIHAAALKRVETCEADPNEAVSTNITGTQNVARACIERGVKRAVLLSTDKACAPHTLYGQTKATAERVWLASNAYAAGTATRFACTRYGNVIGSTGSVVPLWRAQAARGETLSITHPDMTRFWMEMSEAVDLVLLALSSMRGGELLVPKIGAAKVLDLARTIDRGPAYDVVGIRPGEKIHETLVTEEESRTTHDAGTHYIVEPEGRTWGDVAALPFPRVPPGFQYRSDTAERLSLAHLSLLTERAA